MMIREESIISNNIEKASGRVEENKQSEDECVFCDVLIEPKTAFDISVPLDDTEVSLKPALGMLMPGYLLTVTNDHMTSFANMDRGKLAEIDESLTKTERELESIFSSYYRLEHGSDNVTFCGSGGCIDHAHQHLVPADEDVGEYISKQLAWERLDTFEDLTDFKGKPYIYLGRQGVHYVVSEPELPGQWGRRQIGKVREIEHWDWAAYSGDIELALTLKGVQRTPRFQAFKNNPVIDARLSRHASIIETE